jgi:hypothetical protein
MHAAPLHHRDRRCIGDAVAIPVAQQDHVALLPPAGVDATAGCDGEHADVAEVAGEDVDREARRHAQAGDALGGGVDAAGVERVHRGRRPRCARHEEDQRDEQGDAVHAGSPDAAS